MNPGPTLALAAMLVAATAPHGHAEEPNVVASIKPVHSLVAAVMGGVGTPHLIVKGGASPHTYALRPSDAEALQDARLVFRVGGGMELFLEDAIETLAGDATVVDLGEAPGVELLAAREGGVWAEHDEDEGEVDGHNGHTGHEDDHHGAHNPHVWLDPHNAAAMAAAIVTALGAADPGNKPAYEANGAALGARLAALDRELAALLAPVRARPFIVFHDAYQYMEHRYGLAAAGSVTVSPEARPGAARLREIRETIRQRGAACVFAEPQFEPRIVDVLVEGTGASAAVLDPLGAALDDGPGLYFALMRTNAAALVNCLSHTK